MLKELIKQYGYRKLNSLTKYPSIPTLHKVGYKNLLTKEHSVTFDPTDHLIVTEKIDGMNVRIITCNGEYIIGSREELLWYNSDTLFNPEHGIVEYMQKFVDNIPYIDTLTVFYGELYGANIGKHGKQYGTSVGFRVFDISEPDISLLEREIEAIAAQRERNYKQFEPYMGVVPNNRYYCNFDMVPTVYSNSLLELPNIVNSLTLGEAYKELLTALPATKALTDEAGIGVPEGLIIRNADRSKIVKLRIEDYRRTLKR